MKKRIELILIPTLGRIDKQKTWKAMSERMRAMTKFVVQSQEFDEMEKRYPGKVIKLPDSIKTIKDTRQWIWDVFFDECLMVLDDNIQRFNFRFVEGDKIRNIKLVNEEDFDKMLEFIEDKIEEGYQWGGLGLAYNGCRIQELPFKINKRIAAAFFFNRPALPKTIKWNRLEFAEDYDASLQLLTMGFKNIYVSQYQINKYSYAAGGCNLYRTVEGRNESMLKLRELWPDFVKLKEKEVKYSNWKNEKVLSATIFSKKAFDSSQK